MSSDPNDPNSPNYDPTVNQYDEVSRATGGKLNANHAAMAAGMVGGVSGGFVPIVGDGVAAGLQTYAQSAETQNDLVQIARSVGMFDQNGKPDVRMLLQGSPILRHENIYVGQGALLGDNFRRAGMSAAGAIPGALAGAAAGSAILPFGGTLIGGAIGGIGGNMLGGKADDMMFGNKRVATADGSSLDTKVNVSEFFRDKMYAQAQGQLKAEDFHDVVAIVAAQYGGGISKQMVADTILAPLIGQDYVPGDPSMYQYAAQMCNAPGGPNFCELALDPVYIERRPPTPLQGAQTNQMAMQYDPSFNGTMPGAPSGLPSGLSGGMKNPAGGNFPLKA